MRMDVANKMVNTMVLENHEIESVKETIDILVRFKLMNERFGTAAMNMETGALVTFEEIPYILGVLDEFTNFHTAFEIVDENPF